jgi:hypothetical protein
LGKRPETFGGSQRPFELSQRLPVAAGCLEFPAELEEFHHFRGRVGDLRVRGCGKENQDTADPD